MRDVRQLLRTLADVEPRAAVAGACQCARSVLPLVPAGEARPADAVAAATAWLAGEVGSRACRRAAKAAHAAATDGYSAAGRAAANAAHAAGYAAGSVLDPRDAPRAAEEAGLAVGNTGGRSWRETGAEHLRALFEAVSAAPWPLLAVTAEEIALGPAEVQVAWDWLAGQPEPPFTIGDLLQAHARAARLGLEWSDPVQRGVAERVADEAAASALLRR
ncbi:MAG: hypothetical protein R2724_34885 [Bryobacterales bacterium]